MDIASIGSLAQVFSPAQTPGPRQAEAATPSVASANAWMASGAGAYASPETLATLAEGLVSSWGEGAPVEAAALATSAREAGALGLLASLGASFQHGFGAAVSLDATLALNAYGAARQGLDGTAAALARRTEGRDAATAVQGAASAALGGMMNLLA